MRRVLIVGFGDIARRLVPHLIRRYRIMGLIRDPEQAGQLRELGVMPFLADLDRPRSLDRLAGWADHVVHLAPPPAVGMADPRTRRLLAALLRPRRRGRSGEYSQCSPQRMVYISTSGVYGDCEGAFIDETHPVRPLSARGVRRRDAELALRQWQRTGDGRRSVSILRVPGIYAEDRLPRTRIMQGTPAIRPEEDSYSNHIHAEDLARSIATALSRARPGRIYHCSDDEPLRMGDYFDLVAESLGLPRPRRISRAEAMQALPPALLSFMQESRRLSNARLKRELRVQLAFPTVRSGLGTVPAQAPTGGC